MAEQRIQFNDGKAYERMMGRWSRLAGDVFLDWLAVDSGLRWLDVGCGNGAFTEAAVERCAPSKIEGVDPSEGQLEFARTRLGSSVASFRQADAQSLPQQDDSFDVATMALVLFFVPEPAKGIAEMRRVVVPGGLVAAFAWDMVGGGFPYHDICEELRAVGLTPPMPPSIEASRVEVMKDLWTDAGLVEVEVREITVERTFDDFEDVWETTLLASTAGPLIASMNAADADVIKRRLRARLPAGRDGRISYSAQANAVRGHVA